MMLQIPFVENRNFQASDKSESTRLFEFSVVNQKKKYYNISIGNEALPWVIIPKPQLC